MNHKKVQRTRSVDFRHRNRKKTIEKTVQEIVCTCKPKLVILFGSYGRGKPKKDRDLDLFVVADLPGSSADRIRFVQRAITAMHNDAKRWIDKAEGDFDGASALVRN